MRKLPGHSRRPDAPPTCRGFARPASGWSTGSRSPRRPGQGRAVSDPYPGPVDEVARTAAEAMLTTPARHPPSATVDEIRDFFRDDHVHAALIVSPAGYLQAVVERDDIAGCPAPDAAVAPLGRLAGRTVPAGANLAEVHRAMIATGRRRAAVTSADGRLLGLLCLKASQTGFCSEQDVRARTRGEADGAVAGSSARDRSGQLFGQPLMRRWLLFLPSARNEFHVAPFHASCATNFCLA